MENYFKSAEQTQSVLEALKCYWDFFGERSIDEEDDDLTFFQMVSLALLIPKTIIGKSMTIVASCLHLRSLIFMFLKMDTMLSLWLKIILINFLILRGKVLPALMMLSFAGNIGILS